MPRPKGSTNKKKETAPVKVVKEKLIPVPGKKSLPKAPPKSQESKMDQVLKALSKVGDISIGSDFERKEKVSTGSLLLDNELEGGVIKGKIIECFGPNGIGKTTLGYTLLAQHTGPIGYIDCESNYDKETAEMFGVNTHNLVIAQPDYLEQALQAVLDMVDAGIECIVYDSVAGLDSKMATEKSMEESTIGKRAFNMGLMLRKLHKAADHKGCTVFFINQIRDNVGAGPYQQQWITPGGHALEFQTSYRFQCVGKERIMKGDIAIGHYIKMNVYKNKFGLSNIKVDLPLIYGRGISQEMEVLDLALAKGIIVKSGSWFKHEDANIAQGQLGVIDFFIDNPEFFNEIKSQVI